MQVKPGLLEKQQRRQQQFHVNTSEDKVQLQKRKGSFERTEFGLKFLSDRRGADIAQDSHLRNQDRRHSEEARATYWDVILPVLRTGEESVQIPKINWKENLRVRIGRIAFTTEASYL